mgnify:CR=1 FL=1
MTLFNQNYILRLDPNTSRRYKYDDIFADSGLVIVLVIILSLFSILASVLTIIDHEACPVLFQNNSVADMLPGLISYVFLH